MLFDLQSARRRRTVKVVYVTLAILMGGGLVLFGIGGEVSGGLVDAITESGGGGDGSDRFQQREDRALARTRTNPPDAAAWLALTRARVQLAGQGENVDPGTGNYSREGQVELRQAAQAWERYLALEPDPPDSRTARLMVQAYAALGQIAQAARAQEIVAEDRPTAATYTQLAALYYQAGNQRLGDLARREALSRTPRDEREALRGQLDQARSQGGGTSGG